MHQFGWISERGANFLDLLKKGALPSEKGASNPGGNYGNILGIISISHCVDISYIFLYLIFRPFIFIDAIKTVTVFVTYTIRNNFLFMLNLEKVQSYRRNNSIQAGKVNAKL